MIRLAVLLSGNGSNLQALIDAIATQSLEATVVAVAANHSSAFGLERARRAGIPTRILRTADYQRSGRTRAEYDTDLAAVLQPFAPDLVVLAGWMRILTAAFLDRFAGRVINLHPALPGSFPGTRAIERAFEAFGRGEIDRTGVMVHWTIPEVDAGAPIAVAEVPIRGADSLDDLAARVHRTEHRLLVSAIATLASADAHGWGSRQGSTSLPSGAERGPTR